MPVPQDSSNFFYDNFPKGFDWGSTSSACSIEGGWNLDGRSMSWWDSTARRNSQAIIDQSRPDDAADSYKRFKEDVNLLKEMNVS
jgi:beta-glucosidase/6-phospho-beta-glucosidase/beta-galactosidase